MTHGEFDYVTKIIEAIYDQAYSDGFHTAKAGQEFESGRQWKNKVIVGVLECLVGEGA